MTYPQIQTAAVSAADTYLTYIKESKKCIQRYPLKKRPVVEGNVVYLDTYHITHPEAVSVEVKNRKLDSWEVEVTSYDEEKNRLCLLCNEDVAMTLAAAKREEVELTADLSFLAENIKQWFISNGDVTLLENSEYWALGAERSPGVSEAQWEAVKGSLQNRYSYIWGAPGSGKTERVAAEIIRYNVDVDNRVLLLAPSNAALDRALVSVLGALGIEEDRIGSMAMRLGTPTKHLTDSYAQVCEDHVANRTLLKLTQELDADQLALDAGMLDAEEYERKEAAYEEKCKRILPRTTKERLRHVRILAMTVDAYIAKSQSSSFEYRPEHVILDEAGYCAVIKAIPLLAGSWKLTLLGDHVQLPPVCVMPPKMLAHPRYSGAVLFAQSAAYLDELLTDTYMAAFTHRYFAGYPPKYSHFKHFGLLHSYRMGSTLADVVSKAAYGGQMTGNTLTGTEIIVLHADSKHDEQRESSNEVRAIRDYLRTHDVGDYVILTPYRRQVDRLNAAIPGVEAGERVMTVHRAQGREWDTVIFSAVDAGHMYFCDTSNTVSHGLQVVNTAVTRAKKRLVIVCDTFFWSQQPGQMLESLLWAAYGAMAEIA